MSSILAQSVNFLLNAASSPDVLKLAGGSPEPGSLKGPLITAGVVLAQIGLFVAERYNSRPKARLYELVVATPVYVPPTKTATSCITLAPTNLPAVAMGCAAVSGVALFTIVRHKFFKHLPPDPPDRPHVIQRGDDNTAEAPPPPPPPPPPPAAGNRLRRPRRRGCCSRFTLLLLLNVVPTLLVYAVHRYAGQAFYDFMLSLVFRTRLSVSWIITFIIAPIVILELTHLMLRMTWWYLKAVLRFTIWANRMSIVLPWKACKLTLRTVKRSIKEPMFILSTLACYVGKDVVVGISENPQKTGHRQVVAIITVVNRAMKMLKVLRSINQEDITIYLLPHLLDAVDYIDHLPLHAKAYMRAHPLKTLRIVYKITPVAFKIIRLAGDLYTCWRYLDIGTALCIVAPILLWIALRVGIVQLPFGRDTPAMKKLSEDMAVVQRLLASMERGGHDVAAAQLALTELMQRRFDELSTSDRTLAQEAGYRQDDRRREDLPLDEDNRVDDGRYVTYAETVYYRAPALYGHPALQTPPPLWIPRDFYAQNRRDFAAEEMSEDGDNVGVIYDNTHFNDVVAEVDELGPAVEVVGA